VINGKPETSQNTISRKNCGWPLASVNVLEGIRFYVSFACSWAFAELKKMEGNAKIIKFIARDENVHLAFTQQMLKLLPGDDADYAQIKTETQAEMVEPCLSLRSNKKKPGPSICSVTDP
jgi:ribonucleoside-diphosphate reductase beta chain